MSEKINQLFYFGMVFLSIFIILNTPTASSFFISESTKSFEESIIEKKNLNPENEILSVFLSVLSLLKIEQIGIVSAAQNSQSVSEACCITTKTGAVCQNVLSSLASEICETSVPTSCNQVSQCKVGCCIDESEGLCTVSSTKQSCEIGGGRWAEGEACLINKCQRGCCVLGSDVEFVTDDRCSVLSAAEGLPKDFRDYNNEAQCIALKETQEFGACTFSSSNNSTSRCTFGTELECASSNGQFHSGVLCSNPTLNTECVKLTSTGCYEEKDEIYWYDSCGNRENIYSSDKELSWNEGLVLGKNESCNPFDGNAESSTCGNCNYFLGTKCSESSLVGKKIQDGNFICEDLSCIDENGNTRENGESWCAYDSYIGDGKDTPGSRHWRQSCIDGEIQVEPCADYRGQICVQDENEIQTPSGTKTISNAACVINEATQCAQYNSDNDMGSCGANGHCQVTEVSVDDAFEFEMCTPKYPRGFDLSYQDGRSNDAATTLCSMASQECTVIYVKELTGWECMVNCECETETFTEELNNLCISLGDCGTYVNYIGGGTNNIKVDGAPSISFGTYSKYAQTVKGQFAQAPTIQETAKKLGLMSNTNASGIDPFAEGNAVLSTFALAGTISGATSYVVQFLTQGGVSVGPLNIPGFGIGGEITSGPLLGDVLTPSASWGGVAGALSGIGLGATVGGLVAKAFGLQGQAALVVTISGAIGGGVAGGVAASGAGGVAGASFVGLTGALAVAAAAAIVALIVAIIVAVVMKFLGIGETKEVIVSFECLPWQAPTGGAKCGECNNDPTRPCSKYRCESLGQACRLLNENSVNPVCASTTNDGKPPVIDFVYVSEGYEFEENNNGASILKVSSSEDQNCLVENTPVEFAFETDKFSQCKWDYQRGKYEDMNNYFKELNFYSENHTGLINLPSVEGLASSLGVTPYGNVARRVLDLNMYVKCQDSHGNTNNKEYEINFCLQSGQDLTPPVVNLALPENNAVLSYGTTETLATLYLNEPAECKFSSDDKSYETMENKMICETSVLKSEAKGWKCQAVLPITQNLTNYFVKCRDQPWLEENSSRNINQESYKYSLSVSKKELKIESIKPNGTISKGFEPIEAVLEVKTSGGGFNGVSACYYKFAGNSDYIQFRETFSTAHKQVFSSLVSGSYVIDVKCEDESENVAFGQTVFAAEIDSSPPKVIRAYKSGNNLKLITDEKAECYYEFNRCNFDFANATSMTVGLSEEHNAAWNNIGETYHVKCKDVWGNQNQWCAIKVTPSSFV